MSRPSKPILANPDDVQRKKVFGDLGMIAHEMAQEVLVALMEEVDELNAMSHEFRSAMESTAFRVMQHIDKSQERVAIYEEALPGFTLMAIKKQDGRIAPCPRRIGEEEIAEETFEAAALMIQNFMTRTKQHILSIDHEAVLLILFPVADTRKHLKALGMYATYPR
jgi:hypothetical protein